MKQFGDFEANFTSYENAKAVILPVPYDGTSTWIKGADKGPQALLDASYNLEFYDIETQSEAYRNGIHTTNAIQEKSSPEKMTAAVENRTKELLKDNKFPIIIGGEHSVSIGAIQAVSDRYKNISVLQLDAHTDLRDEYMGSKYNHACVMARAKEHCNYTQVGVRSMDTIEIPNIKKGQIFYAEDIYNSEDWQKKAISTLNEQVYITVDLDVFDPSIMPSTGTPEPGGLLWYQVIEFLKQVFVQRNVVGFDIVELCPNTNAKASDFLAAKLLYKMFTYKFEL